ncbi:MAG: 30S ribosome-binding factor RbfA [Bacteroidota bacterium]
MSIRADRVASLLKEELSALIEREYSDPAYGMITVTAVEMSGDLRHARIFVSLYGSEETRERTFALLEDDKRHIRALLASRVRLRYAPEIEFRIDDTLDRVDAINSLLKKIHNELP